MKKHIFKIKGAAFMAPSALGILTFFVIPFMVIIYYSMVDNPVRRNFVGFDNFISLITNSAFKEAAFNTLVFSLIAVPAAVILSLLLAMLLDMGIPGKSRFRTVFLCPLMVPVASVVIVWQVMFHTNGALNEIISVFGANPVDWMNSKYNVLIILSLFLWKNLGYNMVLFMAAFANIPEDLIEVSRLEGAGAWTIFFKIKLRYLSPTIFFVAVLSLINSFKIFREVYLLTGGYPYGNIYYLQHFMNNQFEALNYQKLSTAAVIMSIVMVIIIGILFIAENKFGKEVEE
jgi:multiple sugar transport system permease protein